MPEVRNRIGTEGGLMLTEHVIVMDLTVLFSDFQIQADARDLPHVPVHQVIDAQFSAFDTFTKISHFLMSD